MTTNHHSIPDDHAMQCRVTSHRRLPACGKPPVEVNAKDSWTGKGCLCDKLSPPSAAGTLSRTLVGRSNFCANQVVGLSSPPVFDLQKHSSDLVGVYDEFWEAVILIPNTQMRRHDEFSSYVYRSCHPFSKIRWSIGSSPAKSVCKCEMRHGLRLLLRTSISFHIDLAGGQCPST